MDSEYLLIDDGSEGEIIENVCAVPPHIDRAILSETLIIESINLSDLPALVVASDQCYSVWIPNFEGEEQEEGLYTL